MARTALATQTPTQAGSELVFTAANVDGHSIDGGRSIILHVANGDASPHTVTIMSAATQSGLAVADQPVTVPAGETWHMGPFDARTFDRASGEAVDPNRVWVDFDAITSMTVAAEGRG